MVLYDSHSDFTGRDSDEKKKLIQTPIQRLVASSLSRTVQRLTLAMMRLRSSLKKELPDVSSCTASASTAIPPPVVPDDVLPASDLDGISRSTAEASSSNTSGKKRKTDGDSGTHPKKPKDYALDGVEKLAMCDLS